MRIYVVQPGDTAYSIARANRVALDTLIYDNQLEYPYGLAVGQALLLTGGESVKEREIISNGYAYTFINEVVFQDTVPFLSELSVFSYNFTTDGKLVPPVRPDGWMLPIAKQKGTEPLMTLTPINEAGQFDSELSSAVLNNPTAADRLIEEVRMTMVEKGYQGLNLDFEYVKATEKELYTAFVKKCADLLHPLGYPVSVALAPKTFAAQPGVLYEGHDYRALGEVADHVFLMTYEWGYTYGPPMAVAPINMVRRVVEYAVSEIPPEKISMGIPNYGYDWILPYERGKTRALSIGNVDAVRLAVSNGAEIRFDEGAQAPYFYYRRGETWHEVWFEDVRSLQQKFALVKEFGLRGVGYWQIGQWFRANWLLLEDEFEIKKTLLP